MKTNLIIVSLLIAATACATKHHTTDLDSKVAAEPPAMTAEQIAERGAQAFIKAPGLTDDQKQKILAVYVDVYQKAMNIRSKIGQNKSLMFKMVASKSTKSKEVAELKKRIVDLDQDRLKIMFKALDDIQAIVGIGPDKEKIYEHFNDWEYPDKMISRR